MQKMYDFCYKKEFPYMETLEELHDQIQKVGFLTQQDLLAYIRSRGENFTFIAEVNVPDKVILTPLGAFALNANYQKVPCKIVLDGRYNPLEPYASTKEGHWFNPYKIQFTPIEFHGFIETRYFSDFCNAVNSEKIILCEYDNNSLERI